MTAKCKTPTFTFVLGGLCFDLQGKLHKTFFFLNTDRQAFQDLPFCFTGSWERSLSLERDVSHLLGRFIDFTLFIPLFFFLTGTYTYVHICTTTWANQSFCVNKCLFSQKIYYQSESGVENLISQQHMSTQSLLAATEPNPGQLCFNLTALKKQ